jgi:hypothetical protein
MLSEQQALCLPAPRCGFIAQKLTKEWQTTGSMTLEENISTLTRQFILDGIVLLSSKEITRLHQVLIHTLEQASTTPVARLALDIVSTMHKHLAIVSFYGVGSIHVSHHLF